MYCIMDKIYKKKINRITKKTEKEYCWNIVVDSDEEDNIIKSIQKKEKKLNLKK